MMDEIYNFRIPSELKEVASRHQQHVAELVAKLRSAGMHDDLVERSIDQLIASYRAQLLEAVKALRGASRA